MLGYVRTHACPQFFEAKLAYMENEEKRLQTYLRVIERKLGDDTTVSKSGSRCACVVMAWQPLSPSVITCTRLSFPVTLCRPLSCSQEVPISQLHGGQRQPASQLCFRLRHVSLPERSDLVGLECIPPSGI